MLPESEAPEADDAESYDPEPLYLSDPEGQVVILDPWGFFEEHNITAAMYRGGTLFGFHAKDKRWFDLEAAQAGTPRKLRPVQ